MAVQRQARQTRGNTASAPQKAGLTAAAVIDGDTIRLDDGTAVRYIGVDTPEKGEPGYAEACRMNRELVAGRRVRLELDREPKDRYGRILAYVFVESSDGELFVNRELLRRGVGSVYLLPENVARAKELIEAQREARLARRGLWDREPPAAEPFYVAAKGMSGRYRFHRPSCESIRNLKTCVRIASRDQALDEGRSPCRTCKP